MSYVEQHRSIIKVGHYIAMHLERKVNRDIIDSEDLALEWERHLRVVNTKAGRRSSTWLFKLYMPACFYFPALAAIIVSMFNVKSFGSQGGAEKAMYWGVYVVLLALGTGLAGLVIKSWLDDPYHDSKCADCDDGARSTDR